MVEHLHAVGTAAGADIGGLVWAGVEYCRVLLLWGTSYEIWNFSALDGVFR